jgi:hypothetical protein
MDHYDRLCLNYHGIVTHKNDRYETTGSFYTLYNLKNIILASGRTFSGDEVYIEVDQNEMLIRI